MIDLKGKEYLLNAILEYCEDIVTVKDLNLNYVAYNRAFVRLMGFDKAFAATIINRSVSKIFGEDDCVDIIVENSKKVIETLETRSYVFRHVGINKIIKQTTTPIIRDGKIRGLLTVSSDVTKEENLKASLIDKNYQLNTLLKTLPLLVYMKDKDRNLIVASDNARNFVFNGVDAYSNDIVIDMEQAEQEIKNEDNYVLQNKKPLKKEKAAVDKDGKLHWYKISKAPIINSKNEVNGLVSIAKNIDKEKQLEKQRDLFLATLTHDLKNPLQAQISSLEMLYKEYYGKIDAEHQEIMELVIESSKYMRDMLCTLLKTCRDNSGIIQLKFGNFDVLYLIEKCVKEVRDLGKIKGVTIKIDSKLKDKEKFIYGDEMQLRRVFANMLNNAVNYAFDNSLVTITIERTEKYYNFSVQNESEEISETLKANIFDKYVCGDPLGHNSGVGLGLYFCRKIIEAHEGKIMLENNGTKNSFSVEIPLLSEKSALLNEVAL